VFSLRCELTPAGERGVPTGSRLERAGERCGRPPRTPSACVGTASPWPSAPTSTRARAPVWTCRAALAARDARMTLEEALLGVARDAARAAGTAGGTRAVGEPADLALRGDRPRTLGYALGGLRPRAIYSAAPRPRGRSAATLV